VSKSHIYLISQSHTFRSLSIGIGTWKKTKKFIFSGKLYRLVSRWHYW